MFSQSKRKKPGESIRKKGEAVATSRKGKRDSIEGKRSRPGSQKVKSRNNSQSRSRNNSQSRSRNNSQSRSRNNSQSRSRNNSQSRHKRAGSIGRKAAGIDSGSIKTSGGGGGSMKMKGNSSIMNGRKLKDVFAVPVDKEKEKEKEKDRKDKKGPPTLAGKKFGAIKEAAESASIVSNQKNKDKLPNNSNNNNSKGNGLFSRTKRKVGVGFSSAKMVGGRSNKLESSSNHRNNHNNNNNNNNHNNIGNKFEKFAKGAISATASSQRPLGQMSADAALRNKHTQQVTDGTKKEELFRRQTLAVSNGSEDTDESSGAASLSNPSFDDSSIDEASLPAAPAMKPPIMPPQRPFSNSSLELGETEYGWEDESVDSDLKDQLHGLKLPPTAPPIPSPDDESGGSGSGEGQQPRLGKSYSMVALGSKFRLSTLDFNDEAIDDENTANNNSKPPPPAPPSRPHMKY